MHVNSRRHGIPYRTLQLHTNSSKNDKTSPEDQKVPIEHRTKSTNHRPPKPANQRPPKPANQQPDQSTNRMLATPTQPNAYRNMSPRTIPQNLMKT